MGDKDMQCFVAAAGQTKLIFPHSRWRNMTSSCKNEMPTEGMAAKVNGKWGNFGNAEIQESHRRFSVELFLGKE